MENIWTREISFKCQNSEYLHSNEGGNLKTKDLGVHQLPLHLRGNKNHPVFYDSQIPVGYEVYRIASIFTSGLFNPFENSFLSEFCFCDSFPLNVWLVRLWAGPVRRPKSTDIQEVQTAMCLLLPEDLAKCAVSEGTKAVTYYTSSK